MWPWAPINLAAVTRSPCVGGNTSGWDEKRRRAVERGGDWRFSKAPSMSAGLDVALSTQASYWREQQNQFPPCRPERPWQEDRRRPYPSLHCGSCPLSSFWQFLTAHTFMDILPLLSQLCKCLHPPPPLNQFPPIMHQALGLKSVRFGADKQTYGARWRGLSWCRARRRWVRPRGSCTGQYGFQ